MKASFSLITRRLNLDKISRIRSRKTEFTILMSPCWLQLGIATLLVFASACDKPSSKKNTDLKEELKERSETILSKKGKVEKTPRILDLGPKGKIQYEDGITPDKNTILASAAGQIVTLDAFEFSSRFALFRSNNGQVELPPERMAMPHIQFTMTQSLLAREVVAAQAIKRGLSVTHEEKIAWLKKQKETQPLVKEGTDPEKSLLPYKIKFSQILKFAEREILGEKFTEFELKKVSKEEVWKVYESEKNIITALVASANNVPTGHEIDSFIESNLSEIKTYFQKNKNKFKEKKKVKLDILRVKENEKNNEKVIQQRLEKAANRLRKGDRIQEIIKALDLEISNDRLLIYPENKVAYQSKIGTSGVENKGPRGTYAWIVRGFSASKESTLKPSTIREIAAKLLRKKAISPALKTRMQLAKTKVLQGMNLSNAKTKGKKLGNYGLRWRVTTFTNQGFVKEFGLVEELVKDAFLHHKGFSGGPLQSREYAYIYKILKTEHASKKRFEKKYDEIRKIYLDAKRSLVIPHFMAKIKDTNIDPKALRIKWGVLQKPARSNKK